MAGIYSQGGSAGHRYAGWLEQVEAKNFQFGGKVFNGSPSAIYVGSNKVWPVWPWLTRATQQAIRGAFEDDGWAVINATNAYLNGIAASDRAKATALAGFINEDPMMVCSLPMTISITMPRRTLIGDGNAYIDTNYMPTKNCIVESKGILRNGGAAFCASIKNVNYAYAQICNNTVSALAYQGGAYTGWVSATFPVVYDVYMDYNTIRMNYNGNVTERTNTGHTDANTTLLIHSLRMYNAAGDKGASGKSEVDFLKLTDATNFHFVPYIVGTNGLAADKVSTGVAQAAGAKGMLDIVNCIFYPNAGTGSFTIPDISYTPSTP